jgi:hypothetical protein
MSARGLIAIKGAAVKGCDHGFRAAPPRDGQCRMAPSKQWGQA